jgi:hypothetical protein
MNARQSVLIAMFLSVAVYLLANAQASVITSRITHLKQTPTVPRPIATSIPRGATDQRPTGLPGGVNA